MRPGSPPFGFSTLTTSAPSWAMTSVQVGPASNCVKSSTRTPARQFGAAAGSVMFRSRLRRSCARIQEPTRQTQPDRHLCRRENGLRRLPEMPEPLRLRLFENYRFVLYAPFYAAHATGAYRE